MKMINLLRLNDLKTGKFLRLILAVQLAMFGTICLDYIGLKIPILRQLIGFIYLTFIPGTLLLRILRLDKLGTIETLLYSVGLSIAILMFTGLLMNMGYPIFGISEPISLIPLIITISMIVLILCILSYIRDKDLSKPSFINIDKSILSPSFLVLILLPFLSIFGTYLVNFHDNHILLFIIVSIISVIPIFVVFFNRFEEKLYPLIIFVIAISLLYHWSLISTYLTGGDIHYEYYFANLVNINSSWSATIDSNLNAMLSIVMLAPIYSNILNMNIIWIFKIIYPLLYALVPLGVYQAFQNQANRKIAFLSVFYFMSVFTFFSEMLQLARQEIAELFFVLLILLMINKNMAKTKRSFLFIVFGVSLAVSHYGLSYIYMFCLITAWLLLVLMDCSLIQKLKDNFHSKFCKYRSKKLAFTNNSISLKTENRTINFTFILLFIVFTLTWYMFVSSSSVFDTAVHIGDQIASSIFTDFLNPKAAQGTAIILHKCSPLYEITKYLYLISQLLIVIGFFTLLLKSRNTEFTKEYRAFSLVSFGVCFLCLSLPYFASALNTTRLFHITLFFLAPLCVIGAVSFFKILYKVFRINTININIISLKIFSIFLMIFLLFNSGLIYELGGDKPASIALNSTFDFPRYNDKEAYSAKWIAYKNDNSRVYADPYGFWFLCELISTARTGVFTDTVRDGYLYLREINVKTNQIILIEKEGTLPSKDYQELNIFIFQVNKVYSNEGSQIYYYPNERIK